MQASFIACFVGHPSEIGDVSHIQELLVHCTVDIFLFYEDNIVCGRFPSRSLDLVLWL